MKDDPREVDDMLNSEAADRKVVLSDESNENEHNLAVEPKNQDELNVAVREGVIDEPR